jgi:hypothetical protein
VTEQYRLMKEFRPGCGTDPSAERRILVDQEFNLDLPPSTMKPRHRSLDLNRQPEILKHPPIARFVEFLRRAIFSGGPAAVRAA